MHSQIDISSVLRRGFELYRDHFLVLILSTLLATVLSVLTVGILAGPMIAGLSLIALGLIDRRDPPPDVGRLFQGFSFFVPSLIFVIAYLVVMFVGSFVLGLMPMIGGLLSTLYSMVISTFVMFAIFNIVDRGADVAAAVQQSVEMVKANFWIFFGLYIIASVLSSLGVILCLIGIFLTLPLYPCWIAIAYRDLFPART
ncbi:MAG: hypothetical protein NZ740_01375 [Kiritimatiellae bacterium]|nr:hypothetical protein [Kiritimatiellia bacterium]MDW8457742.1 hypothetical protein [Verrucomicrobiota bacterium]